MSKSIGLFTDFDDQARLWVFMLAEELTPIAIEPLKVKLREFLDSWKAHGQPMHGDCEIIEGRFLLIVANEQEVRASGCSIDSLNRELDKIIAELGLTLLRHSSVLVRLAGKITVVPLLELDRLIEAGTVSGDTSVFNTLLRTLGAFRDGSWEIPLSKSPFANRLS